MRNIDLISIRNTQEKKWLLATTMTDFDKEIFDDV